MIGSGDAGDTGGRSPAPVLSALAAMLEPRLRANASLWLDERAAMVMPIETMRQCWRPGIGGALPGHIHAMPAEAGHLTRHSSTPRPCARQRLVDR